MSKEAKVDLKSIMDSVDAGRQEPKRDEMFPLHAQWNSFPFGSNERTAVASALGMSGLSKDAEPVKHTRPFFQELRNAGLIDANGNPSNALKQEVEKKVLLRRWVEFLAVSSGK